MLIESKIRRDLTKLGYRLKKTPARHYTRTEYGPGYEVIDERNVVVLGASQREYEATIDDVQAWLDARKAA
ncbi:hypothetical protein [Sinorhizobium meliloti]|uniref:hypothetical protein n=1 Tax=Rhizobium meliloti TaxID=382 RepID=UPI0001E4EB37|nr:hypothetical protein [Sinorhizobium meliloti]AEG09298.1 hypothetical protein SinmeB_5042 [Sinorhizobium meliloti BL225C]MDE4548782.1 hypothetical protein [Sinorhizobium meliloti]MDE4570580.1 hypothetical protein [Sinorhizobium meliloti]RVO55723.1 hypothetical protein CN092_15850 [Sinorhizobium meliloti]SDZ03128.1 hypothetical protein SAMN04244576_04691 [Sinorhizobium meliloti]